MPRKGDKLTEPVERIYDTRKNFWISRYMNGAIKDSVREHHYTSEAEWWRDAAKYYLLEGLRELEGDAIARIEEKYRTHQFLEAQAEKKERGLAIENMLNILGNIRQRRGVLSGDVSDVKRIKEALEIYNSREEQDEIVQHLNREWKKFGRTRRGRLILEEIEKKKEEEDEKK